MNGTRKNMENKAPATSPNVESLPVAERIDGALLTNHIHFLVGEINESSIEDVMRWILYENLDDTEKTLNLYINSRGGSLPDAMALIDMMRMSKHDINTYGFGSVMSAAFLIFSSGALGGRFISKNASIMCHQFSDNLDSKYHDIKAQLKETENCNDRMLNVVVDATGLSPSEVKKKLLPPSDVYLTAEELVQLNAADAII